MGGLPKGDFSCQGKVKKASLPAEMMSYYDPNQAKPGVQLTFRVHSHSCPVQSVPVKQVWYNIKNTGNGVVT